MEHPADRDVDGDPWQIEEGRRTATGNEAVLGLAEVIDYLVDALGDRARFPQFHVDDDNDATTPIENDDADPTTTDPLTLGPFRKWNVNAWRLKTGWQRDSRNDFLMPTRGTYQRLGAEVTLQIEAEAIRGRADDDETADPTPDRENDDADQE